jgi:hypothetical protein
MINDQKNKFVTNHLLTAKAIRSILLSKLLTYAYEMDPQITPQFLCLS